MIALRKWPYLNFDPLIVNFRPPKSGLPPIAAISGVTSRRRTAATTAPKAAPMTTATARSTTLPRRMNSRNSLIMPCGSDGARTPASVAALASTGASRSSPAAKRRTFSRTRLARSRSIVGRRVGDVRGDQRPRRRPQRVAVRQRLGVGDVERRAADDPRSRAPDERVGVDQRAARDVDDPRVRLHLRQLVRADQVARLVGRGRADHEVVGRAPDLAEASTGSVPSRPLRVTAMIFTSWGSSIAISARPMPPAPMIATVEPSSVAVVRVPGPGARVVGEPAHAGDQQPERVLGDLRRVGAGGGRERDAAAWRGRAPSTARCPPTGSCTQRTEAGRSGRSSGPAAQTTPSASSSATSARRRPRRRGRGAPASGPMWIAGAICVSRCGWLDCRFRDPRR